MKKKIVILCSIIVILLVFFIILGTTNKEYYITDNEHLYEEAIKYLVANDTNPEKANERYKLFTEYEGFDITEDNKYRYAYMWISDESYYVKDNKIMGGSGSSMPYKFTFEKTSTKVVKYENPKDGTEYVPSIKAMFPKEIANKVLNYKYNDKKLKQEVKKHYSDLEDTTIHYGEEQ